MKTIKLNPSSVQRSVDGGLNSDQLRKHAAEVFIVSVSGDGANLRYAHVALPKQPLRFGNAADRQVFGEIPPCLAFKYGAEI
jgi:hypothetical protein